jgi:hypothetical protein
MKAKLSFLELHAEQDKISQGRRAQRAFTYLICVVFLFLISFFRMAMLRKPLILRLWWVCIDKKGVMW